MVMAKKEVKSRLVWIGVAILIVAILFLAYKVRVYQRDIARLDNAIEQKSSIIRAYDIALKGEMVKVFESKLLIVESNKALRDSEAYSELLRAEKIRNVFAIGELRLTVDAMRDSLELFPTEKPKSDMMGLINGPPKTITLPVEFGWEDEYATSYASINLSGKGTTGFKLESVPVTVTLGSRGMFRKDYISAVTTPSPYIWIDYNNFVLNLPKSKTPLLLGAGFIGGVAASLAIFWLVK